MSKENQINVDESLLNLIKKFKLNDKFYDDKTKENVLMFKMKNGY